jgi:two-component system response regulator (stage 0 sporulation protein F)
VQSQKILVVEDNAVEALGLMHLLQQRGYDVVQAEDAFGAMNILRSENPDLILLDVKMPVKTPFENPKWDGVNFLQWMHAMTNNRIPVILLSGTALVEIQPRLGQADAVAYFQKPANVAELLAAITSTLEQNGAFPKPPASASGLAVGPASTGVLAGAEWPAAPGGRDSKRSAEIRLKFPVRQRPAFFRFLQSVFGRAR